MWTVGPVNGNLCFFGLVRTWRRDDFIDCSGHRDDWLFRNSRSIQIQLRYFRGSGHARLRHFLTDADTCRIAGVFPGFLVHHAPHNAEIEAAQSQFAQ